MSAKRYFYWDEEKQIVQGPGKIQVLAVLFRQKTIDADTPVCVEETEDWFPLRKLPEFGMLPELAPEGARIVMPGDETDQQVENREERKQFALKAMGALGIGLVAGGILMVIAALDPSIAGVLIICCLGLTTLGTAMTLVTALDDGSFWILGIIFVPFVDIAYALMNHRAANWVLLRYISYLMILGIVIASVVGEALRQMEGSYSGGG